MALQAGRTITGISAGLWPIVATRKRPLCRYFQCRREFSHGPGRVRDPLKIRCTPIFWDISRIRPFEKWPKSSSDHAVSHLCAEINATETLFPGTELRLIYELVASQNL